VSSTTTAPLAVNLPLKVKLPLKVPPFVVKIVYVLLAVKLVAGYGKLYLS
jgi:hypothetical protein